jgi:hypothetical protein
LDESLAPNDDCFLTLWRLFLPNDSSHGSNQLPQQQQENQLSPDAVRAAFARIRFNLGNNKPTGSLPSIDTISWHLTRPSSKHLLLFALIISALRLRIRCLTISYNGDLGRLNWHISIQPVLDVLRGTLVSIGPQLEHYDVNTQVIAAIYGRSFFNWWFQLSTLTALKSLRLTDLSVQHSELGWFPYFQQMAHNSMPLERIDLSWQDLSLFTMPHSQAISTVDQFIWAHRQTLRQLSLVGTGTILLIETLRNHLMHFWELQTLFIAPPVMTHHFSPQMRGYLNKNETIEMIGKIFSSLLSLPKLEKVAFPVNDLEEVEAVQNALMQEEQDYRFELFLSCLDTPELMLAAWRMQLPFLSCFGRSSLLSQMETMGGQANIVRSLDELLFNQEVHGQLELPLVEFSCQSALRIYDFHQHLHTLINRDTAELYHKLQLLTIDPLTPEAFFYVMEFFNFMPDLEDVYLVLIDDPQSKTKWQDISLSPLLTHTNLIRLSLVMHGPSLMLPYRLLPMLHLLAEYNRNLRELKVEIWSEIGFEYPQAKKTFHELLLDELPTTHLEHAEFIIGRGEGRFELNWDRRE